MLSAVSKAEGGGDLDASALVVSCFLLAVGIADIPGVPVAEKRRTSNTALSAVSIASISRGDYRAVSIEFIDRWIWTNTNSGNGEVSQPYKSA